MVKLRIKRFGRKKLPFYRIGAFDSRKKRDGDSLVDLASYDPRTKELRMNDNQIKETIFRLNKGAQPTKTVEFILKKNELIKEWFINKKNKLIDKKKQLIEKRKKAKTKRKIKIQKNKIEKY